jgi:transcriptional regulator with XRE-family HTH domain
MAIDLTTAERRQMGDRLRAARTAANLPIRAVARATGMSYTAVGAWERDGYLPNPEAMAVLADLYHLPAGVLFAEYHARRAEVLAPLDGLDTSGRRATARSA